jgi:homoserine O-succinyltransferase/O-acetyltransferase
MPVTFESRSTALAPPAREELSVVLVNNMPDSVLESTEAQFASLLAAAAGDQPLRLRFAALAGVARGAQAAAMIAARYFTLEELIASPPDAIIVTGTEPRAPALPDEPYWTDLVRLFDWAREHTASAVYSCLAAHAAALHYDGIARERLAEKRSGVYAHGLLAHPLTAGLATPFHTPHSRWNDLPTAALRQRGYTLISQSSENGADIFVKDAGSLMLFLQGHPEYEERTLLKEYQRDVGRFLSGQQAGYPPLIAGYFDPQSQRRLAEFREAAHAAKAAGQSIEFPYAELAARLENRWRAGAEGLYRNWLRLIDARRAPRAALPV